jgi:hypothetical protein
MCVCCPKCVVHGGGSPTVNIKMCNVHRTDICTNWRSV